MARACGREDDVQVLNFLTGSTDVDPHGPGAARLSNTFNPFLHGSADAITQLLIAQMARRAAIRPPGRTRLSVC